MNLEAHQKALPGILNQTILMNHVFGYARVSTEEQNLDTQLDLLQKAKCDHIYQDKITGMSESRPALDEMLSKLRPGDTVLVARFFRLGRSKDHLISLVSSLHKMGVTFKALDLGVDTSTISGKLVVDIFSALAEFDRESLLEKTRHGQRLAKAKGVHMGRPAGIDEEKFLKVKTAFEKGCSAVETVNLTGISLSSVKRYRKLIQTKQ